MDLEASIMYTDEDGARTRWEILKQLLDVRCGQMELDGKTAHQFFIFLLLHSNSGSSVILDFEYARSQKTLAAVTDTTGL